MLAMYIFGAASIVTAFGCLFGYTCVVLSVFLGR